jgi:hypothetical protein
MWLLQLLAWIGSELFIARATAENKPEVLSIVHAGEETEQPNELGRSRRIDQ